MPDLPREGPDGRLEPADDPGGPGGRAPSLEVRQAIPIAAALLVAGSLLVLGDETDRLATTIGDLTGSDRSFQIAVYTATVLGTLVGIAAAALGTAVRGSERWRSAGWAAILALSIMRLAGTAPLLFWRLGASVDVRPALWLQISSATAWLVATLVLLAAPPVGRSG